ncbi:MAG: TfoX/Sxy family protein [Burkholderiales bacterium]|nr:TfoX/Sxy family protein [Burkholderiales bacterium]
MRLALAGEPVTEKKMMGGLCFMVRGHMVCGVAMDRLMVRVGADGYEAALRLAHAAPMDFTGRPLRGFVYVAAAGVSTQRGVAAWMKRALAFVAGLPAKDGARRSTRR